MNTGLLHISDLIKLQRERPLTEAEQADLDRWLTADAKNRMVWEQLQQGDWMSGELDKFSRYDAMKSRSKLDAWVKEESPAVVPVHRIHFLKTTWFRYAAAILLITGTGTYLYKNNQPQKEIAKVQQPLKQPVDIQPGGNKAILTLADGSTIVLDSAANGNLAQQGGTKIIKLNEGALAYNNATSNGEVGMNTISTPKGGQYQITLPDGSKVWLNAASSITFPTAFTKNRMVSITGETYFEIAADKNKPFIVSTDQFKVNVLGTAFNVNAYSDETVFKTTLINGSVNVQTGRISKTLLPGQQAQSNNSVDAASINVSAADTEKAVAWKNGVFNFNHSTMAEVMRQLARWYDIEVVYEKGIPNVQFGGELGKKESLASLLKGLSEFGIHYRLEDNRKLIILP